MPILIVFSYIFCTVYSSVCRFKTCTKQQSWQRVPTPLFHGDAQHCLPLHFLFIQILSIPPSPNHYSLCLFIALFLWLNGCICHIWCTILLNDIMDLHMFSLGTLISEGVCCVFYTTRHQIYWGLTNNKCFCWYSDLMSHKKSRAHSKHRGQETNSPNKYILRSPVMCSQQLSLFH